MTDDELSALAQELASVAGVVGVVLGGSRARGEHRPDSDYDFGVYYRPPLDVDALVALARGVAEPDPHVTSPGEWGPWVDGGAWLKIDGTSVDWIYRDVDRVDRAWKDAQAGRYYFHGQVGHPLGVPDFAYAGEVALGIVLCDPTGELTRLHDEAQTYPPALADALVRRLEEATFILNGGAKAVLVGDATYVAGCVFRAVGVCAHALHGRAGRWLINEKGCIASAGRLDVAPDNFAPRAHALLGHIGITVAELEATLGRARDLVADTATACGDA